MFVMLAPTSLLLLMMSLITGSRPAQPFSPPTPLLSNHQPRRDVATQCLLFVDCSAAEHVTNSRGDNASLRCQDSRRDFLRRALVSSHGAAAGSIFFAFPTLPPVAHAVVMDPNVQKVFEVGKDLTTEQAVLRFQEGEQSLRYLVDHYDEICEGGGDNVRRYLGTVGVGSGLYGIGKVLKVLQRSGDLVDDVVEFSDLSEELIAAINQADGSAYMAIFTTFSSSSTPPKKYFDDSKVEAKAALRIMDELSKQLKLR
jgi:hypothetical protein